MSNFFLLNEAVDLSELDDFKKGMSELNAIDKKEEDNFRKHASFYNLDIYQNLCSDFGQVQQVLLRFIEQLITYPVNIQSEKQLDETFPDSPNAFLGIVFANTAISAGKQITDDDSYQKFEHDNLWDVSFRNLWSKREKLFPNLILCGEVEQQISRIGNSSQFNQIIERLKEFDKAVSHWNTGRFNYKKIEEDSLLEISPETDITMSKYGNKRRFRLPSGGTEFFELHIKTRDLRFHFYPDNATKKVYIGYIGPHLSTQKYK